MLKILKIFTRALACDFRYWVSKKHQSAHWNRGWVDNAWFPCDVTAFLFNLLYMISSPGVKYLTLVVSPSLLDLLWTFCRIISICFTVCLQLSLSLHL